MEAVPYSTKTRVTAAQLTPRHHRVLLLLILLCAALLRLYHINQPYTDLAGWREASVAMMADNFYHRNPNILFPEVSWSGPGETYNGRELQTVSYISSLLYHLVGQHEWVGRLVALLFGVWGVFALYQLVRRIWGEREAIASAAMMAILPGAIFVDRSFLPDPAMVALVTTSVWMLVAYLQTNRHRFLVLTAVFACWGFLSKITGMIVLLPMLYATVSMLGAQRRLPLSNIFRIAVYGMLVFVVVAAYYLWARHLSHSYPPYHFAGSGNWVWDEGLDAWMGKGYFLYFFRYIFSNWTLGYPFILLGIGGAVISIWVFRKSNQMKEPPIFHAPYLFHLWLLGCVIFYLIGAKELVWNFWNFHLWHPIVAAFGGFALVAAWSQIKRYSFVALPLTLGLAVWITVSNRTVLRNAYHSKNYLLDYRMGVRLNKLKKTGDLVVTLSAEVGAPVAIFYSNTRGWVFPPAGNYNWQQLPQTDALNITALESLRKEGADWFGIVREQFTVVQQTYPQFVQYLTTHFAVAADEKEYIIFKL